MNQPATGLPVEYLTEQMNFFAAMRAKAKVLTSSGPLSLGTSGMRVTMLEDHSFLVTFDDHAGAAVPVTFNTAGAPLVPVVLGVHQGVAATRGEV